MLNILVFELVDIAATVIAASVVARAVFCRPALSSFQLVAAVSEEVTVPESNDVEECAASETRDPNLGIEWPDATWPTALSPWDQGPAAAVVR